MRRVAANLSRSEIQTISGDGAFYRALIDHVSNDELSIVPIADASKRRVPRSIVKAAWRTAHLRHWGARIQPRLLALTVSPPPKEADGVTAILTPLFRPGRRIRTPIVVCTQGVGAGAEGFYSGWTRSDQIAIHRSVAKQAAAWITWHQYGADGLLDICPELAGRVRVLHPPIRPPVGPAETRAAGPVRFLLVGRGPVERKGILETLAAWQSLLPTPASLTLVSEFVGPTPEGVRSLPPQPADEVTRLMASSDVILLPSRFEPYGLVVPEAYRLGCASIVSDFGCLPEVAGDGGLVAETGSATSIASAMRAFINDEELLRTKQNAALTIANTRNAVATWRQDFLALLERIDS